MIMTIKDETEVKETEAPEEEAEETEETEPESSQEETEGDEEGEPEGEPEAEPDETTAEPEAVVAEGDDDELAVIEGETPRERAFRLENKKLRGRLRQERKDELFGPAQAPVATKKELPPERAAVLGKYKTEEINALKEIFPVLAEEMGFVRETELEGRNYSTAAQSQLDTFLEKHPEYLPENDKDGTLWERFKGEYGLYKQPTNPKDFVRIFDRIHRDVFGIKPAGPLKAVKAQQEKTKVASHAGASAPNRSGQRSKAVNPEGLRLDMLKGFSDEEKEELIGSE